MTVANSDLHTLPISRRPPRPFWQTLRAAVFFVAFSAGCVIIVCTEFLFLFTLRVLPVAWAHDEYRQGIRYTKGAFGNLLLLMSQFFAPTSLAITFETEGQGSFTSDELEQIAIRNEIGEVIGLRLPTKSVIVANHQIYADWWYMWSLMHFSGMSKDMYIVLKRSLKWLPIIGWGMQLYDFIFLARSWNSDRLYLSERLARLAKHAETKDIPLAFLLYPEGTLVSHETRPVSKKFADKEGIPDTTHILLPRSTGLHYSLRSLSPRIPALQLLDISVAYPGIPPLAYGQHYYTLRSIFFDNVPPPKIHMHIRRFDVARDVPIGDISASNADALPRQGDAGAVEVAVPERERIEFEHWLRGLWRNKDAALGRFLETGAFVDPRVQAPIEIQLKVRSVRQVLDAYCCFLPALVGYGWAKLKGSS